MLDDDGSEETDESSDQISNTVLVDDSGSKVDELAAACSSHPLLLNGLEISSFLAAYDQATAPPGMVAEERAKAPEDPQNNFAPVDIRHSRATASWKTFRCPSRDSCTKMSADPGSFFDSSSN
ncbi:hypothetical protein PRZ48_011621 [Zasmidium cellare]|uniref:Uncharacterized protein n=1 Tax=Zasmidium cellare TaxID=395010 RepID=A0ABR0E7H9_ZASCE|nr:hypothetical protein PRZ48_011621 [Zasmidium cellare]